MDETTIEVHVSREARARAIRDALRRGNATVRLTAGQRRALAGRGQRFPDLGLELAEAQLDGGTTALPLRKIGYWSGGGPGSENLPDPRSFVDPTWDADERRLVMHHLVHGRRIAYCMGYSACRMCDHRKNGTADLSDGVYVWPEGLPHYLLEHDVRLPEEFVRHIDALEEREQRRMRDETWWTAASIVPGSPPVS